MGAKLLADFSGVNLLFAAEILAVLPYALRSYRIQSFFSAFKIYWRHDRMPKEKITILDEKRMITIMIGTALAVNLMYIPFEYFGNVKLPSYNSLAIVTEQDGTFRGNDGSSEDWSDI